MTPGCRCGHRSPAARPQDADRPELSAPGCRAVGQSTPLQRCADPGARPPGTPTTVTVAQPFHDHLVRCWRAHLPGGRSHPAAGHDLFPTTWSPAGSRPSSDPRPAHPALLRRARRPGHRVQPPLGCRPINARRPTRRARRGTQRSAARSAGRRRSVPPAGRLRRSRLPGAATSGARRTQRSANARCSSERVAASAARSASVSSRRSRTSSWTIAAQRWGSEPTAPAGAGSGSGSAGTQRWWPPGDPGSKRSGLCLLSGISGDCSPAVQRPARSAPSTVLPRCLE